MKLKSTDILSMTNHCLKVNGEPFVVEYPDDPLWDVTDNKLVTFFSDFVIARKRRWNPEEIEGYFA